MKSKKFFFYVIGTLILGGFLLLCILLCSKKQAIEPEKPCIDDRPVEDTTRVYLWPIVGARDALEIYPPAVFARFYPWVTDTAKIMQLLEKHHLRFASKYGLATMKHQLCAWLCVTDNRRAEYHFTPYGKEGFCNFGADSLVEYAFGVFDNGRNTPDGIISFRFNDDTPQSKIDSLIETNSLRLIWISPDIPYGKWYNTLITPRASKNVLDLGYELQFIPFIRYCIIGMLGGGEPVRCE